MATSFDATRLTAPAAAGAERRRYLFGPVADFMTFGGFSMLAMAALLLVPQSDALIGQALMLTLVVALVINFPHFMASYMLFYRQFRAKAFGQMFGPVMRARYLFAGIGVPTVLLALLGWGVARSNAQLLAHAANAMALFVGWHYVKQGYGLLMTDCALKRQFFTDLDKKVLLANCYAAWLAAWVLFNAGGDKIELIGVTYYPLTPPAWLINAATGAALATTIAVAAVLLGAWRKAGRLPMNGVLAYVASIYPWMIFAKVNSYWFMIAPAFHSIQYLAVVSRFELNRESAQADGAAVQRHLLWFSLAAIALGALTFKLLPALADATLPYDRSAIGPTAAAFAAMIFINVHHYFIDNVIWRRDNPETQRFLFS